MTFFYNLSFARDNAVILFTSTHRKCQKLVNLQHIDFPNFISEVEVVNMKENGKFIIGKRGYEK